MSIPKIEPCAMCGLTYCDGGVECIAVKQCGARLLMAVNSLASLVLWKRADDVWVARTGSANKPIYGYGVSQVDAILTLATEVQS